MPIIIVKSKNGPGYSESTIDPKRVRSYIYQHDSNQNKSHLVIIGDSDSAFQLTYSDAVADMVVARLRKLPQFENADVIEIDSQKIIQLAPALN